LVSWRAEKVADHTMENSNYKEDAQHTHVAVRLSKNVDFLIKAPNSMQTLYSYS